MDTILFAVGCVTAIGAVCASVLCAASKAMAVKTDERAERILEILPGSNCGACGCGGCAGYAAALLAGKDINLCTPGGAAVAGQLSVLLGLAAGDVARKTAVVRCGGRRVEKKARYAGIPTCAAAKPLYGGENACAFGCIGYGDCMAVCPIGAICMDSGAARVVESRCTGCGLCVKACPNRIISVLDAPVSVAVLCASMEKGAAARKKCGDACLGCGRCVRECETGAIKVEDSLARIDYEKCTACGRCAAVCPGKCILYCAV